MAASHSLHAQKTNFLRQQVRILSQPLRLPSTERIELSAEQRREIEGRVNSQVRRHNAAVYDRVAISAVAARLVELYWDASSPQMSPVVSVEEVPREGEDVLAEVGMERLCAWAEREGGDAGRVERVRELRERREGLRWRCQMLRELAALLGEAVEEGRGPGEELDLGEKGDSAGEMVSVGRRRMVNELLGEG